MLLPSILCALCIMIVSTTQPGNVTICNRLYVNQRTIGGITRVRSFWLYWNSYSHTVAARMETPCEDKKRTLSLGIIQLYTHWEGT
ncbi:hypothetical protein FKM82_002619 [Ascaphus truei]